MLLKHDLISGLLNKISLLVAKKLSLLTVCLDRPVILLKVTARLVTSSAEDMFLL